MEKINGIIQKVIFSNSENGYAVVSLKIDYKDPDMKKYQDYLITNLLTVTGFYDRIPIKEEEYEYLGEFCDTKYGIQLKASSFTRPNQDSPQAVVNYLSSEYFPGIGKVIAGKVFTALGSDCLKTIKKDKDSLDKVPGITPEQKDTIYDNLLENERTEKAIVAFIGMGFTMAMAKRIEKALSSKEMESAKTNPYLLIDKVEGIGFMKVDKIALEMGIKKNDFIRLEACLIFILNSHMYETGNTYIEKDLLKTNVLEILNREEDLISNELFDGIIETLSAKAKIIIDENNYVYDLALYHAEKNLASSIAAMINHTDNNSFTKEELMKALEKVKDDNQIEYSPMQEKAIISALEENMIIITGGPGTGKTTIVKGIIDTYARLFKNDNILEQVVLLAPTGRAGKRLNEVTGHPAQTIHKFLGYDGKNFLYGDHNRHNCKLVIIDEMSMVDTILASKLFRALPPGCRVIIVGDVDQIPSIAPGEVLSDLIHCQEITVIKLDKIHRQAQDSTIIHLAHAINNGIVPENILEKQNDRNFIYLKDHEIVHNIEKIIAQATSKGMSLQKDIQVLIPMYRGTAGIDNVNHFLQEAFNPLLNGDEVTFYKQKFRINDKVIQLVNRSEEQVMNGDIGYIHSFTYENHQIVAITVQFETTTVTYIPEEYEQLKLAYAISIHKSQGSEFMTVIIPFSKSYYSMLKRRLYYTAITRAKKYLIMIGDIEPLKIAAQSLGWPRKTRLKELVSEYFNQTSLSPYDFM